MCLRRIASGSSDSGILRRMMERQHCRAAPRRAVADVTKSNWARGAAPGGRLAIRGVPELLPGANLVTQSGRRGGGVPPSFRYLKSPRRARSTDLRAWVIPSSMAADSVPCSPPSHTTTPSALMRARHRAGFVPRHSAAVSTRRPKNVCVEIRVPGMTAPSRTSMLFTYRLTGPTLMPESLAPIPSFWDAASALSDFGKDAYQRTSDHGCAASRLSPSRGSLPGAFWHTRRREGRWRTLLRRSRQQGCHRARVSAR